MIYLDNAATTPMCENAVKTYGEFAEKEFFNPSAIYKTGVLVHSKIDDARKVIANALGSDDPSTIIFTSSATESNNLAVFGSIRSNFRKLVFSQADHPSTYAVATELKNRGFEVVFCPLQQSGEIDYDALEKILDERTDFISFIHVSNETGAINDLHRINEIRKRKCPNSIFHADGVQAFSKIKINVDYFGVDLYTISAHKMFGPKGISSLYARKKSKLKSVIFGGGQEGSLRSGTENVPAIMAFKTAVENIGDISKNFENVKLLKQTFLDNLIETNCEVNSRDNFSPYILSLSFNGVKGETLVHMLEQNEIYISTGSACSSKKIGNRVLDSMGKSKDEIVGSVRISFSKNTTKDEVIIASNTLKKCYLDLKEKLR